MKKFKVGDVVQYKQKTCIVAKTSSARHPDDYVVTFEYGWYGGEEGLCNDTKYNYACEYELSLINRPTPVAALLTYTQFLMDKLGNQPDNMAAYIAYVDDMIGGGK